MLVRIKVFKSEGVPDGETENARERLQAHPEVLEIKAAKYFEVELVDSSLEEANKKAKELCEKLLANSVYESYDFTVDE
ncbi:MAG TPA: phosphoribosylformylglycinamidine synthase subunit PurS [Candidatus Paceibacterota bacterium]|nr:phosphoribosylformylglycinamidine synthase subunit PurS [Candidatus Paceibacterota bacterium]